MKPRNHIMHAGGPMAEEGPGAEVVGPGITALNEDEDRWGREGSQCGGPIPNVGLRGPCGYLGNVDRH